MKSHIKILALLFSVSSAFQMMAASSPESIEINGIVYEEYDENQARIKSSSQEIDIPEILSTVKMNEKEYVVDSISDRAFINCKMSSIIIPSTIRSIGEKAFYGCKGLTTLEIPSSVTFVGDQAFEQCSSIESVSISSSLTRIPEGMFYDCTSLSSVTIPHSVRYIGRASFKGCFSMQSVIIPNTVDSIGREVFYACEALKTITIPSSVKKIGMNAFWNCKSLESATISSSVAKIEYGTFYGCKSLTSVIIPSAVTTIGERSFEQCENLPLVVIPAYVTTIDEDAFKNCLSLKVMVSYPGVPPIVGRSAFYRMPSDAIIYVPAESLVQYPSAEGWNELLNFRALGSIDMTISSSELNLNVGGNAELTVSVDKAYDVSIFSEEWTTSDPEVATVKDGFVTAVGEGRATISLIIIDDTGCPHIVSCDVYVDGVSGIKGIAAEDNCDEPVEYYNLNGMRVTKEALTPGLYIKKQGKSSVKILIK